MNIGFYGHSNCAYRSDGSFIDIISTALDANIVNTGVRQGSEERILFELKKTKNLDLAIIFHSEPHFLFVPNADRDLSIKQLNPEKFNHFFGDFTNEFHIKHHEKFINLFKTKEELQYATHYFKEYFYHPDLQMNRFYGSIIQIDQYLDHKSIHAIHVVSNNIPNWFSFKSGIVDKTIMQIVSQHSLKPNETFANVMTREGNAKVAQRLLELIGRGGEIRTHEPISGLQL